MTQYVRARAVAHVLNMNDDQTPIVWARAGKLPGMLDVGGVKVFNVDAVATFVAEQTGGITPEQVPVVARSIRAALLRAATKYGTSPKPRRS